MNRYIYHYYSFVHKGSSVDHYTGIAQLEARILSPEQLGHLKELICEEDIDNLVVSSLSYLGRETVDD